MNFTHINSGIVQKMIKLRNLFGSFFKIGLFTFGGGAAMLPLLRAEVVEKKQWASDEELLDYYSIGQCTPGIIAINTATFIGYKLRGIRGAIVTTLGMVMPSLIIITLIAAVLQKFIHNQYVAEAFAGIRVVVAALILEAVVGLWKKGVRDKFSLVIFILSFWLLVIFNLSPVLIVLGASALGMLYIWRFEK